MILESGLEPSFQICLMKNTILTYILLRHLRWVYLRFWYFNLFFVTTIYNTRSFWISKEMVIDLKQKEYIASSWWGNADWLQYTIWTCLWTFGSYKFIQLTSLLSGKQIPRASASAVAFGMGLFSGNGSLGPGHHRAFAVTSESRASDLQLRFHDCCHNYKVSCSHSVI